MASYLFRKYSHKQFYQFIAGEMAKAILKNFFFGEMGSKIATIVEWKIIKEAIDSLKDKLSKNRDDIEVASFDLKFEDEGVKVIIAFYNFRKPGYFVESNALIILYSENPIRIDEVYKEFKKHEYKFLGYPTPSETEIISSYKFKSDKLNKFSLVIFYDTVRESGDYIKWLYTEGKPKILVEIY